MKNSPKQLNSKNASPSVVKAYTFDLYLLEKYSRQGQSVPDPFILGRLSAHTELDDQHETKDLIASLFPVVAKKSNKNTGEFQSQKLKKMMTEPQQPTTATAAQKKKNTYLKKFRTEVAIDRGNSNLLKQQGSLSHLPESALSSPPALRLFELEKFKTQDDKSESPFFLPSKQSEHQWKFNDKKIQRQSITDLERSISHQAFPLLSNVSGTQEKINRYSQHQSKILSQSQISLPLLTHSMNIAATQDIESSSNLQVSKFDKKNLIASLAHISLSDSSQAQIPIRKTRQLDTKHLLNKKNSMPVLPVVQGKRFVQKNEEVEVTYRVDDTQIFAVRRRKIVEYESPEVSSDEEYYNQREKARQQRDELNKNLLADNKDNQSAQENDDNEPGEQNVDDINYELYNLEKRKQQFKIKSQAAKDLNQKKKNNAQGEDIDEFIDAEKKLGIESELEIMMDIFAPKIRRDHSIQDEIQDLCYDSEQFVQYFEKFVKHALENEKFKDTDEFLYFKMSDSLFQELVDFFDLALKKKYGYSQFVVNDYLTSFDRHKRLVVFHTLLDDLGGENNARAIVEMFVDDFLSQELMTAPAASGAILLPVEHYKGGLTKLIFFLFKERHHEVYPHHEEALRALHCNRPLDYKQFFLFKQCFWRALEAHRISPLSRQHVIKYIEKMRSALTSDPPYPKIFDDFDYFKLVYMDYEWKVSIDGKCSESFIDVNTTILQIFLKGFFYWAVLGDTKTYECALYVHSGLIKVGQELYKRLHRYLMMAILAQKLPTGFIRQVQIRLEHIAEALKIKRAKLRKIGATKLPSLFEEMHECILKNGGFRDKLRELPECDERTIERTVRRIQKQDPQQDLQWLSFALTCFLSPLDCYHPLDLRAGMYLNRTTPSMMEVYKLGLAKGYFVSRDHLSRVWQSIQREFDYQILVQHPQSVLEVN